MKFSLSCCLIALCGTVTILNANVAFCQAAEAGRGDGLGVGQVIDGAPLLDDPQVAYASHPLCAAAVRPDAAGLGREVWELWELFPESAGDYHGMDLGRIFLQCRHT